MSTSTMSTSTMSGTRFSKWYGPDGMEQFIINQTGCKPLCFTGITPRINKKTTILKSVDNTDFYDDVMSDINNVKYTLFGKNGDQSEKEKKYNEKLLNKNKTEHIYLYRVKKTKNKKEYIWYGKYEIINKNNKQHPGEDKIIRNIIVLSLKKIGN